MPDETIITADTDDGPMGIFTAGLEANADAPLVVMFLDAPGVRESLRVFARQLADEGFRVALPDLHHRHGDMIGYEASEMIANPEHRTQIVTMLGAMTDDQIQHDLDATLSVVSSGGQPMGCIGFCLGARPVFQALMRLPDQFAAGAMWHPSFLANDVPGSPHLTAAQLTQPLYVGIGDADEVQSIEMHQPFFDAVAPLDNVDVQVFAGADHGFSWPTSPNYHAEAATVSWERTMQTFSVLRS